MSHRTVRWCCALALCAGAVVLPVNVPPAVAVSPAPAVTPTVIAPAPITVLPSRPPVSMHPLHFSPVPGRYSAGHRHGAAMVPIILAAALVLVAAGVWLAGRTFARRR
jgi:hypothetical protein